MDIKDTLSRLKPKLKPVTNGNSWTLKTAGRHGKGTKEITAFMVSQQLYTKK